MMKPHIYCETKPNGYALDIDDKHFFYTSLPKLLIGAAWHLAHDFPEYTQINDMLEVMAGDRHVKDVKSVKKKINTIKVNGVYARQRNKEYRAKIAELTNDVRQLRKDNKKLSDKLFMLSQRAK